MHCCVRHGSWLVLQLVLDWVACRSAAGWPVVHDVCTRRGSGWLAVPGVLGA
jgi:hypothetical protein